MEFSWKPVGLWVGTVVVVSFSGVLVAWLALDGFYYFGAQEPNAISAVSLQVALLTQFFLVATFGIAILGIWGYTQIRERAQETARTEARKVAEEVAAAFFQDTTQQPPLGVEPEVTDPVEE